MQMNFSWSSPTRASISSLFQSTTEKRKWSIQFVWWKTIIYMGYWPSVRSIRLDIVLFLFSGYCSIFVCLKTSTPSRSIKTQKWKERGQEYPSILTGQAWSINDLLSGFRGNLSFGMRRVVPRGQDSSILLARVANHSAGFDSSHPFTELVM